MKFWFKINRTNDEILIDTKDEAEAIKEFIDNEITITKVGGKPRGKL